MDFNVLGEIMEAVNSLKAGSVVGVGGVLTVAIRVYRMFGGPWPGEKWGWLVTLVTFVVGLLAALFTGVFGFGLGWGPAVLAALGVAVNAAGFHSVSKTAGEALPPVKKEYKLSPFGKAASVLIPRVERTKGLPFSEEVKG